MLLYEVFAVALQALRANKLRSVLTMLGIVIGVAAVIAMIALGTGAQTAVNERIRSLGTTLLTVMPGQQRGIGGFTSFDDRARLTMKDANALEERAPSITAVQPEMNRQLQVQYQNMNTVTQIIGTTANFLTVRKYELQAGRMFTSAEDNAKARVAVLGPEVVKNLGLTAAEGLIGEPVRIRGIQFTVVGVLKSKGQSSPFQNPDDQLLIPLQTARYRVIGSDRVRSISVLAVTEDRIPEAMADIQRVLRREHRLRQGRPDDFQIRNQADFLNIFSETTQVFTYLLAGIAAVSLLVGGIGIMNIMLVSVTERTREIGVRKALGAKRRDIRWQFLTEAMTLTAAGGVLGILVGAGLAKLVDLLSPFPAVTQPFWVGFAFFTSLAVGLFFGLWPAEKAARLDPIEALRRE